MFLVHCQPQKNRKAGTEQSAHKKAKDPLQLAKMTAEIQSLVQSCTVHGPKCLARFLENAWSKKEGGMPYA